MANDSHLISMKKQQTSEELDAIIDLQDLCAEIERETANFERDIDGVDRDMNVQLAIVQAQVARTDKEFKLFEKGVLSEMNTLITGYLPQKTAR